MTKLERIIKKFSATERKVIKNTIIQLKTGSFEGLDVKKLQGSRDIYRVRKGSMRIMYYLGVNKEVVIFAIARRSDNTYNF
ncbi:MAG: hypothetical protein Q7S81_00155 [bacterium]|nr:hypothetical protein [bacterium]